MSQDKVNNAATPHVSTEVTAKIVLATLLSVHKRSTCFVVVTPSQIILAQSAKRGISFQIITHITSYNHVATMRNVCDGKLQLIQLHSQSQHLFVIRVTAQLIRPDFFKEWVRHRLLRSEAFLVVVTQKIRQKTHCFLRH